MPIASAIFFGILTLVLSFRIFFSSKDDFMESIRYYLTPDIISLFKGESIDDFFGEFKLVLWLALSALAAYGGYQIFAG